MIESEVLVSSFLGQRSREPGRNVQQADKAREYRICLTVWYPLAAEAAHSELRLHLKLLRFRGLNNVVTDATLHNMHRHMFYLKPETVVFNLASESASADV